MPESSISSASYSAAGEAPLRAELLSAERLADEARGAGGRAGLARPAGASTRRR